MDISLAHAYHIDKKHIAVKSLFNYGLANKHFNNLQEQFQYKQNYDAFKSMESSHSTSTHQMTSSHLMSSKSRSGKPHRIKRMMVIAGIAFAFAMASNPISAQKLTMQLTQQDGTQAKGTMIVTGSDTVVTDTEFNGEATYILSTVTSAEMLATASLRLYPNPAGQSVSLDVPTGSRGRLKVHDFTGRLLGVVPYGITSIVVPVTTGVVLLTWIDQNGQQSLRLVCGAKKIRIGINITESSTLTLKSESADIDDYTIDFSDPTKNIEDMQWNRTIHLGENITIDETIDWTEKIFYTQGKTSSNASLVFSANGKQLANITTANGNVPLTNMNERFDQEEGLLVNIEITAPYANGVNFSRLVNSEGTIGIDTILNRQYTTKINNALAETNIRWTQIPSGNTIITGQDVTQTYQELAQDSASVQAILEKTGYVNDTITFTNAKPGITEKEAEQEEIPKEYTINIELTNNDGKTETGFRGYILEAGDTTAVANFSGTSGQLVFNSTKENLDAIVGARNIYNFTGGESPATLTGNNNVNVSTDAIDYLTNTTIHAFDNDQGNASGASVEIAGQSKNADANGNANFTIPLTTNANNVFTPYQENVKVTKGNASHDFAETNTAHTLQNASTPTLEQTVAFVNEFFTYSNNSTANMNVKIWDDNAVQSETTSDGSGNYSTPVITSTDLTFNPDSIVYSAVDKISENRNKLLHDGGDVEDVVLADTPNEVTLDIGHADHRADTWINEGTYHIRTNDGIEHTFPITSGVQTFTVTGNYDGSTPVKTWVEEVTGFENLVQTYVASQEQPIASNGTRSDTLNTTLGALDGRIVYNLVMDTDVFNDDDYRARVNGGKEWNGEVNGHRGMTRELLMQRVVGVLPDYSGYVYADDLTENEKTALRENSALFDQNFMNRDIGYVIMESQEQEVQTDDWNNPNKVKIAFDTRGPPGNVHVSSGTHTYDAGRGTVPDELYTISLTEEFVEAIIWPTEVGGSSTGMYEHIIFSPQLTQLGENVSITNLTYKGGQAPRE